jgi:hypothetical protein
MSAPGNHLFCGENKQEGRKKGTGRLTAPLRDVPLQLKGIEKVHRATYCAIARCPTAVEGN